MKFKLLSTWETEAGLKAYTAITYLGTINGYVIVPTDSKYYDADYLYVEDIDVHGGLSYSGFGPLNLIPNEYYALGFDCAHADDGRNFDFAREHGIEIPIYSSSIFGTENWKDEEFVKNECEKLAKQIKD
jgi:hypothetical protein